MKNLVAPSLLSADFYNLKSAVELIENSDADWYHLDIMDGVFVPNISFGLPILKSLKKHTTKPFDTHLMIVEPDRYIDDFHKAGADLLVVHYEACTHLHRTISKIKSTGMKAGVSLNPHTSVQLLKDVIQDLDMVLLMSVNPGFGGQSFIENTYNKIKDLKEIINEKNPDCLIQIDGGVTEKNAKQLVDAGADVLVAGSYVFGAEDPKEAIKKIKF
jgi:ribulose-phosphate 3-epimerase